MAFLMCLPVAQSMHQLRRRLVDVLREVEVLDDDLAGAAAAAGWMRAGAASRPRTSDSMSISSLCLSSLRLALDAVELQEHSRLAMAALPCCS